MAPPAASGATLVPVGPLTREARSRRRLRVAIVLIASTALSMVALVASIGLGEYPMTPWEVVRALAGGGDSAEAFVVLELRLPRAVLAFAVGVVLGLAGAVLQGLTRNPLAAPEVIGVSAGANVAAVMVIVALPAAPIALLPPAAFAGALVATAVVYGLAWRGGSSPARLLLLGVGVTTVAYAIVVGIVSTVDEIIHASQLVTFMAGSVYGKGWKELAALAPWLLVLVPLTFAAARHLDALSLGDTVARGLGVNLERRRLSLLALAAGLAGAGVAVAGPVGFVGLMAPHIARRLVGGAHGALIPVSAIIGGAIVIVADAAARTAFAPIDVPVGVVTAIVGAPYLVWLLSRRAPASSTRFP